MKEHIASILSAAGGTTATVSATALANDIMFYVGLTVTVVTTFFNLFLELRRKWRKEKEQDKDEVGE